MTGAAEVPKLDDVPAAVAHAVAEALGDAYDCTRTWSAWRHGTMGPGDFYQVAEDGDRVAEIALAAINAWEASKPQPAPAIDLEQFREAVESLRLGATRAEHHEECERLLALIDGQAAEPRIDLAADHTGMLVDYSGLIGSAQRALLNDPGIAEMLLQLRRHLEELGRRWYAGDRKVVDEFLQLYCIESDARAALVKRPTKGDGVVTAPRGPDQPDLCDLCRVRDEVRTDAEGIPFCQECWDGWQASEQPTKGEGVAHD